MTSTSTRTDPVLVSGASGRCGSAIARRLLAEGRRIRVLTRDKKNRVIREFERQGAQVAEADMLQPDSLQGIFRGVAAAVLVTTGLNGFDEEVSAGRNFIHEARREGVRHLIFQSVTYADTAIPHCATKGEIEKALQRSGVAYTILRPGLFLDNLRHALPKLACGRKSSVTALCVFAPHVPLYWVVIEDIGRAVALCLGSSRSRSRIYDLVAPTPASHDDLASIMGKAAGVSLSFSLKPVTNRDWLDPPQFDRQRRQLENRLDEDYYAPINDGLVLGNPSPIMRDLGMRFTCPEDYIRDTLVPVVRSHDRRRLDAR